MSLLLLHAFKSSSTARLHRLFLLTVMLSSNVLSQDCVSYDPCASHYSCDTCTAAPGCGWCHGQCWSGSTDKATYPSAPASCRAPSSSKSINKYWAWRSAMCPVDACIQHVDCIACTADQSCGWCGASQRCYMGTDVGAVAAVAYAGCRSSGPTWAWKHDMCDSVASTPLSSQVCISCKKGMYLSETSECVACKAGTYASTEGALLQCPRVPSGMYPNSDVGATAVHPCDEGWYSIGGSLACLEVPAGYVANALTGATGYVPCPVGTYSNVLAVECMHCPAGTSSSVKAATSIATCAPCPHGTFSKEKTSSCAPCSPGWYSRPGASECTLPFVCSEHCDGACNGNKCPQCNAGYEGTNCEHEINPCAYNNGRCGAAICVHDGPGRMHCAELSSDLESMLSISLGSVLIFVVVAVVLLLLLCRRRGASTTPRPRMRND